MWLLALCLLGTQAFGLLHAVSHGLPGAGGDVFSKAFSASPVPAPAAQLDAKASGSTVHAFVNAGPAFAATPLFAQAVARALLFYRLPVVPAAERPAFQSRAPPLPLR